MAPSARAAPSLAAQHVTAPRAYLVEGGITSMAAAAFMIRDGDMFGHNITILEESGVIGGSLDGAGSPETGYVLRGGRMLESKYLCTFALFDSIPTLDERGTVTQEILRWNETREPSSKSRLFRHGQRRTSPKFGLSERQILTIERLVLEPESLLGDTTIAEQFDSAFFRTDFWFMWCTTFAFQPWHSAVELKRYLARFVHMVDGFDRLCGIMRTVYNQYDSLVRPLRKWLEQRCVQFELLTCVTDLGFAMHDRKATVQRVIVNRKGVTGEMAVTPRDYVVVTLGSMTEASTLGAMDRAPAFGKNRMAEPGRCGRRSQKAIPSSAAPPRSPITSINRNGCRSRRQCMTRPCFALCAT